MQTLRLTEVRLEDKHGCDVDDYADDLSDDHQPVPGTYGQGDHQQLRDHQRRVRYGHDVQELPFKEHEGAIHDDATLVDTDQYPNREDLVRELSTLSEK